jgi:hypothetical protein
MRAQKREIQISHVKKININIPILEKKSYI